MCALKAFLYVLLEKDLCKLFWRESQDGFSFYNFMYKIDTTKSSLDFRVKFTLRYPMEIY